MTTETGMSKPWTARVSAYLDNLEFCVDRLNEALDEMRLGTKSLELTRLDGSHRQLADALQTLESLIAARQELIQAEDAPGKGLTLRDILGSSQDGLSRGLSERCQSLAKDIDISRERAVSLFVCQFHLADLSENVLALLRGVDGPRSTYHNSADVRRPAAGGGSLLNKSA